MYLGLTFWLIDSLIQAILRTQSALLRVLLVGVLYFNSRASRTGSLVPCSDAADASVTCAMHPTNVLSRPTLCIALIQSNKCSSLKSLQKAMLCLLTLETPAVTCQF